jgi:hypothetical protein
MSEPSPIERELSRRGLLVGAGAGALGLAGLVRLIEQIATATEALAQTPAQGLGPADSLVRATIEGFADTIVPGPAGGADPDPGAIEAKVVDEIYDDFYGASGSFPVLHSDLLVATPLVLGRPETFDLDLPYPDRERVILDRVQGGSPLGVLYIAIATLVWVTYYGTASSKKGLRYIGLPPHSDGYWPRHSYGVRFRGMTKHGNTR